jgi:multidrug transporter EmrE-like cation transporter
MSETEPRFAGQVEPKPAPPPWSTEAQVPTGYPPAPPPPLPPAPPSASSLPPTPVVTYGPGPGFDPDEASGFTVPEWAAPVTATVGGILAVAGSLLTWVTLRFEAAGTDSETVTGSPPKITYRGLSLLEGRAFLVLGVVAAAISVVLAMRRMRDAVAGPVLAGIGALGLTIAAFSAIGNPTELSTLLRSSEGNGALKVSLPNGPGVWLAMGGAALILVGGLLSYLRRQRNDRSA